MNEQLFYDVAMIGPALLEGPVCTLLPLNQRQEKITSLEPERLLVKNAYSSYRPFAVTGSFEGQMAANSVEQPSVTTAQ
jgi:hypothetical protein